MIKGPVRAAGYLMAGLAFWLLLTRSFQDVVQYSLPNKLQDLVTLMSSVILESLPFIVLGLVLSVVVQIWLPDRLITRRLPRNPFLRRIWISFIGMFLPVCECGNVPLSRGLMVQGFSVGESLTFLLAAPILNPITIITTHAAFPNDPAILWARLIGAFVIANLIGWLFSRQRNQESMLVPAFVAVCKAHDHTQRARKPARSLQLFARESNNILPALFVGAFIAALIQVLVPRSILYEIGSNPVWSIAIMMLLAFVISICANVDAFFALAFSNSFTTGSIVSFLIFGPMIDIKMLNLMRTTYRPKVLAQVSVVVALASAIIGLVVQYAF